MMVLAWIGALLIGLSLGLLGSGGSIITVPVLVYLVGQPEKLAITGALAIVGGISLCAALPWSLKGNVDRRSVLWFGLPGIVGSWCGSAGSQFLSGGVQLFLFALVMWVAALRMFQNPPAVGRVGARRRSRIVLDGVFVGVVTGLLGVGGGFLIVPALVLLGGLALPIAIGSSLWIIAINAWSGFMAHVVVLDNVQQALDWSLIALFIGLGSSGALIGQRLAEALPQAQLRRLFASFLVVMGGYMVWHTLPGLLGQ